MNKLKIFLNSFIVFFLFISPHTIYSILPNSIVNIFYGILLISYLILFFSFFFFDISQYVIPLLFSFSFILFGIINSCVHNNFSFFNLFAPFIAFFGYLYINEKKISLNLFNYFFIALYIYFYLIYYSVIPDLFFRPGFDEDAIVFDNASSNAIPIALNITLYSYIVLDKLFTNKNTGIIFCFSIINLLLIIIQQSRIGILVALFLFFLALFNYDKSKFVKSIYIFLFSIVLGGIYFYQEIQFIFEVLGGVNGFEALDDDIRGQAQKAFFKEMDITSFFFGYKSNYLYAVGVDGDVLYTYNVFLDIWNRYGFFQIIVISIIAFFRLFYYRKFYFQLYYFIPFLLYSLVESIFFPNFWDCIIYILLFYPRDHLFGYSFEKLKYSSQIV